MTTDRRTHHARTRVGKSRTRKEDARLITGRTRWTDNITPARHAAPGRGALARARTPGSPGSTPTRPARCPVSSASTPPPTSAPRRSACPAPGRSPRTRRPRSARRWRSAPCTSPVRASRSSSPATPAAARDAAELVVVDYDDLPPVLDMEAALRRGRHAACTRTWARTRARTGCSTPARPAPAAASRTPSPPPRPTPTRSSSAAGSASSG